MNRPKRLNLMFRIQIIVVIISLYAINGVVLAEENAKNTFTISGGTYSGGKIGFEPVGHIGGIVSGAASSGNYVYIGVGTQIIVIDVSQVNSQLPTVIGKSRILPGYINKLTVDGDILYAATNGGGFRVFDISIPNIPVEISCYEPESIFGKSSIEDFIIQGNTIYLADDHFGLRIIDATDKTKLILLGSGKNPNTALATSGIGISGNYAYITQSYDGGIYVFDISQKTSPQLVKFISTTPGQANGIIVDEHYAYVSEMASGLRVFDISNPMNPILIGTYNTNWTSYGRMFKEGNLIYAANWSQGLVILNVADPAHPNVHASYQPGGYTNSIVLSGNNAFIACDLIGLCIADISNSTHPVPIGSLFLEAASRINDIEIMGEFLYAASNFNGLRIINISDPVNLFEMGYYPSHNNSVYEGNACCVALENSYAYLADDRGLRVVQISDPYHPVKIGEYVFSQTESPSDLVYKDSYVYMVDNAKGLRIFDVQNRTSPSLLSTLPITGTAFGLDVDDDYAYIAADTGGLRIINIQNKMAPTEVGSIANINTAMKAVVKENLVYVADMNMGLVIYDVTNKNFPIEISRSQISGSQDIEIRGNLAYIASFFSGLVVLDISNPEQPFEIGKTDWPNHALGVQVNQEQYAFVANNYGGIISFQSMESMESKAVFLPFVQR